LCESDGSGHTDNRHPVEPVRVEHRWIAETQQMLDFCAEHDVTPEIELIEPDYVNEAYDGVLASDVRYRFVIDTSSL
jgi:D-arabinose 1-dehydrogenase-like Zn-dependent alcohol dehydrogenase